MLILGFDTKYRGGTWVKSVRNGELQYATWSYIRYRTMHSRCSPTGVCQRACPTYRGCYTSNAFKDFQLFTDWASNQIGYEMYDWQLDKDILVKGNKLYSENTCVFIPRDVNCIYTDGKSRRGKYPRGVYFNKRDKVFTATIRRGNKTEYIGNYNNPQEAFLAYKREKECYVKHIADKYKGMVDIRVYDALMNYTIEITD